MVHARGSAQRSAVAGQTQRPDTCDRWQRDFRGQESELRQLRRWLTALLPGCPARDDLISVAVELGTNAIQHTSSGQGGWFTVEVTWRGAVARIDVTDDGAPCGPQITDDPMSDCGRGLIIVRALSESCGVRGGPSGRTVWAELAWAPQPVPEPATPPAALPNGHPSQNGHPSLDGHLSLDGHPRPNGHSSQRLHVRVAGPGAALVLVFLTFLPALSLGPFAEGLR
jgi:serine/threonine-protein kinase RsbW